MHIWYTFQDLLYSIKCFLPQLNYCTEPNIRTISCNSITTTDVMLLQMERRRTDEKDHPAMSRLFVLCSKNNTEQEFRESFSRFGTVEEVWVVKKNGENKGVAYVKFSKTSEAAKAMEEMNGEILGQGSRPIKVLVASSRQQGSKRSDNEEEKYLRLFIIISKDTNEDELEREFREYGSIEAVTIIRDKQTREGKGFAYIKFKKFSHAALAFENCDSKYKAVFAEPKPSRGSVPSDIFSDRSLGAFGVDTSAGNTSRRNSSNDFIANNNSTVQDTTLNVMCSPTINQDQLWRLFDIIPGLDYCQINGDYGRSGNAAYATVVYSNPQSASYAREKLHGLEYPPGQRLIVKFLNDSQMMPTQNTETLFNCGGTADRLRDAFCSVPLPSGPQPMANSNREVAARCFVVCVQHSLPANILRQVFSRFGDLIDVYLLPQKNCGYAKYASKSSAEKAIETLHGAEICGVRLKVLEAEEPNNDDRKAKRMRRDD